MKYIIFRCSKCKRWIYARSVQKSSKCGLCQRSNSVPESSQFQAEKPTEAMKIINQLNLNDLKGGIEPTDLVSQSKIAPMKQSAPAKKVQKNEFEAFIDELRKFQLEKFISKERGIPDTMISAIMRNANLPSEKKADFITKAIQSNRIIRTQTKNSFYVVG